MVPAAILIPGLVYGSGLTLWAALLMLYLGFIFSWVVGETRVVPVRSLPKCPGFPLMKGPLPEHLT